MTFEEILIEKGKLLYTSVGISMLPWIHEGEDVVVIEKITSDLKRYDTVLFVRPCVTGRGHYVLHRILKCYPDGTYYIKGDNTITGEHVSRENIIGILTMIQQPERLIKVTSPDYRMKVWLWWNIVYPVRSIYRRCKYKMRSILKK